MGFVDAGTMIETGHIVQTIWGLAIVAHNVWRQGVRVCAATVDPDHESTIVHHLKCAECAMAKVLIADKLLPPRTDAHCGPAYGHVGETLESDGPPLPGADGRDQRAILFARPACLSCEARRDFLRYASPREVSHVIDECLHDGTLLSRKSLSRKLLHKRPRPEFEPDLDPNCKRRAISGVYHIPVFGARPQSSR